MKCLGDKCPFCGDKYYECWYKSNRECTLATANINEIWQIKAMLNQAEKFVDKIIEERSKDK